MKIGLRIKNTEYWQASYYFMKMLKSGMENTYDTNFNMEINQQILADLFNKMIPDMYSLIHWGINIEKNVIPSPFFSANDVEGEIVDEIPGDTVYYKLSDDEIKIDTSDILIDDEVDAYLNACTVTTPNGGFKNIECGCKFFVYDTNSDNLTHY